MTQIAYVPLYTTEDGKVVYNEVKPRILMGKSLDVEGYETPRLGLAFEELDFNSILNRYYVSYQRAIQAPRVIKVRLLLSDIDLSQLDLTRPVYFEQFGHYYAILKLEVQTNGECKGWFLELK